MKVPDDVIIGAIATGSLSVWLASMWLMHKLMPLYVSMNGAR